MTENNAPVGWQGIVLDAPADWSLVAVSGDDKKGYFRVDSPIASAVEVKWERASGKAPDLMVKGREFLSTIEKSLRKKKIKFSKDIKQDKSDPNAVNFLWRADRLGQGRLVYCQQCQRVIIAQITAAREENVSTIAPDMLGSIRDHREDGWIEWALYGLGFAVPDGYTIEKHVLMSGYIALFFKRGAQTLVVERWGLASTLLAKDDMEEWYRKDAVPDIKGYKVNFEPDEVKAHQGLKIVGRRSGIKQMAKAAFYSLTLHPHPKYLTGYVWHCADSNRLFSVRAAHVEDDDITEKVRDLIKCH